MPSSFAIPLAPRCVIAATAACLIGGCAATPDPDRALRLDAFGPDGRSDTDMSATDQRHPSAPIIVAFEPGDEVRTVLNVDAPSHFERLDDGTLRATRAFELMLAPNGVFVRNAGGSFERRRGSLSADFGLSEERKQNEASITLQLEGS